MKFRQRGLALVLAGASLSASCATTGASGDPDATSWRKVTQAANRFAIFINEPGPDRTGDLVTFRMVYVYMPGEVKFEEKDLGWQEYHAMTVNCADNTVRVGPRTRYAPDGSVVASDDDQTFSEIPWGVATDDAARAKCKQDYWIGDITLPNDSDWMTAARKHIAETTPPNRP
jgi:hypothetical protein